MDKHLESIFETKKYVNSKNETINIYAETNKAQCEFLQKIIREHKFKKSLEIGFAYGTSTLAIVEEIAKNGGRHLVIDKFQGSDWGMNGLDLVQQAGYGDKLDFREEYCYKVLPKLHEENQKFDFAYIDSTKQMDWLLVDFFFIDKMLAINGIIVFDDVAFPGIRKLLRYISQFPNYKIYAQHPWNAKPTKTRKLSKLLRLLPKSKKILKAEVMKSDFELGINTNCVALIKTSEDERSWKWHVEF
jgi:predicted O-methyltransferase YrrM